VAHSPFSVRFGYALWIQHLKRGEVPGWAEIGRAVTRTGQAVSAWATAAEAPVDYRVHAPLAEFLEVDEAWLVKNVGEPPQPDLWQTWRAARAIRQPPVALRRAAQAPSSKTAAKKGRSA
jgi:hypothetical protein